MTAEEFFSVRVIDAGKSKTGLFEAVKPRPEPPPQPAVNPALAQEEALRRPPDCKVYYLHGKRD